MALLERKLSYLVYSFYTEKATDMFRAKQLNMNCQEITCKDHKLDVCNK